MRRTILLRALGVLLLSPALLGQVTSAAWTIDYRGEVLDRAFVQASFVGKSVATLALELPTWTPGSYEIKKFAERIEAFAAKDAAGKALDVAHDTKLRWTIQSGEAKWPISVSYERLDMRQGLGAGGRPAPRRKDYVGFTPTDTIMYVVGGKEIPHEVTFKVPEGWLVMMSLEKGATKNQFKAPDYDTLVDAPVEAGILTVHRFTVGGTNYVITLDRRDPKFPMPSLEEMLKKIVRHEVGMFGGEAPYKEYQFQIHEGPGYGLEHLSSTTIAIPYTFLRRAPASFDSLFSHEFFHLWNVKRLRPKILGPFDYTKECRTKALWLSEGITDYYADVVCWRTGLWNDKKFLESTAGEIDRLQSTPKRFVDSVEVASHQAFDRGYAALGGVKEVDYYNKGKLVGLCLDLLIRDRTQRKVSLDDVMRALLDKYGLPKPGFEEDALPREFSAVAGFDLVPFFAKYVSGTEELPYAESFKTIGVDCRDETEIDDKTLAKWIAKTSTSSCKDGQKIEAIDDSLERQGLMAGDVIVEANGKTPAAAGSTSLDALLRPASGSTSQITVLRANERKTVWLTLPHSGGWALRKSNPQTDAQRAAFEAYRADPYSAKVVGK